MSICEKYACRTNFMPFKNDILTEQLRLFVLCYFLERQVETSIAVFDCYQRINPIGYIARSVYILQLNHFVFYTTDCIPYIRLE